MEHEPNINQVVISATFYRSCMLSSSKSRTKNGASVWPSCSKSWYERNLQRNRHRTRGILRHQPDGIGMCCKRSCGNPRCTWVTALVQLYETVNQAESIFDPKSRILAPSKFNAAETAVSGGTRWCC